MKFHFLLFAFIYEFHVYVCIGRMCFQQSAILFKRFATAFRNHHHRFEWHHFHNHSCHIGIETFSLTAVVVIVVFIFSNCIVDCKHQSNATRWSGNVGWCLLNCWYLLWKFSTQHHCWWFAMIVIVFFKFCFSFDFNCFCKC